jgi:hypothetical protein
MTAEPAQPVDAERRLRALGINAATIAAWRTMATKEGGGRSFDELMAGIPDDWLKVLDEVRRTAMPLPVVPWEVWAHAEGRTEPEAT